MITGLPHIKPRSLRHFFAALAVQPGANMEVLQKQWATQTFAKRWTPTVASLEIISMRWQKYG